ncbi:MAG: FAD-dependent oxidoreductase [Halanaeroarchaeum sp.]
MEDVSVLVRTVEAAGPDTVTVEFESPSDFAGRPGQFVRLQATIDGEVRQRFYTLSSPDTAETFEVTVEVDPEGSFGPWLADRGPGDEVTVSGPYGDHYYEGESSLVVVAAGPGIGPAVGIGERAIAEDASVALVIPADRTVHQDRLSTLASAGVVLVEFESDLEGAVAEAVDAVDGTAFVYGFEGFASEAIAALDAAGVSEDATKIESFGPGPDD